MRGRSKKLSVLLITALVLGGTGGNETLSTISGLSAENVYAEETGTSDIENGTEINSEDNTEQITPPDTEEPDKPEPDKPDKPKPNKPKPKLSITKYTLKKGHTKTLKVKNNTKKVKWYTSNKKIATVTQKGVVEGIKGGCVTITAKVSTYTLKCKITVMESIKNANKWVLSKGRYYHYNKYGVKATGRTKINNKYYFFNQHGQQRVGWIKNNGNYYYYNISVKSKGYLQKNKSISGIKLKNDGSAKETTSNTRKLKILVSASEMIFTNFSSDTPKSVKLKETFLNFARAKWIVYKNFGGFKKATNWDVNYASIYFNEGYGDCYTAGCAYAYLAAAIGYKNVYCQSSGGHGWCNINGKFYDPNWAMWGTKNKLDGYAVTKAQCGKGKRMRWDRAIIYNIKIS